MGLLVDVAHRHHDRRHRVACVCVAPLLRSGAPVRCAKSLSASFQVQRILPRPRRHRAHPHRRQGRRQYAAQADRSDAAVREDFVLRTSLCLLLVLLVLLVLLLVRLVGVLFLYVILFIFIFIFIFIYDVLCNIVYFY